MHGHRLCLLVALCLFSNCTAQQFFPGKCASVCQSASDFQPRLPSTPVGFTDRASQWGIVTLNQIKANLGATSPPGVGRVLAIVSTCMYEATTLFSENLQPVAAKDANKIWLSSPDMLDSAIDGAAVKALVTIFGAFGSVSMVGDFLEEIMGSGSKDSFMPFVRDGSKSFDATFPVIAKLTLTKSLAMQAGSLVCQKVLEKYTQDGYDGLGNPVTAVNAKFFPVNTPQSLAGITECDAEMNDLNRWQPLCIPRRSATDGNVGTTDCTPQNWLAPTAGKWYSFAVPQGGPFEGHKLIDLVRAADPSIQGGPPKIEIGTAWEDQFMEVIEASATLDDARKLVAELWADGPDSTAPPGTWYFIALNAIRARGLDSVEASKLLMMVGNAVLDGGIGAWRIKLTFDSIRPLQMIQCGSLGQANKDIVAWKGPYQGVGFTPASTWQPYQLDIFKTPPFGGYISGHSTFSSSAAEVLRLYFGGDEYVGPRCTSFAEGESTFERKIVAGEPGFVAGLTDVPNKGKGTVGYSPSSQVTLCYDTFTEAELQASQSRIYGGIHVRADAADGERVGRQIGKAVFNKAQQLFGKEASVFSAF